MEDHTLPADLAALPEFVSLSPENRRRLLTMHDDMRARALPEGLVRAGLASTARLLMEEQAAATPIMEAEHVRRFIAENNGAAISRRQRAVPRKETRQRSRESLHDRVSGMVGAARSATRRHEILRLRRELLGLDQAYVRRTLGEEGSRLCAEINEWLVDAATRLNRR